MFYRVGPYMRVSTKREKHTKQDPNKSSRMSGLGGQGCVHMAPRRVGLLGLLYIAGRKLQFIGWGTETKDPSVMEQGVAASNRLGSDQRGRYLQSTLVGNKGPGEE